MSQPPIDQLAASVTALGDQVQQLMGAQYVLLLATAALAETHPDAPAFARALRANWQRSGSLLSPLAADEQARAGIEEALEILEERTPVPLNVRPPDRAEPPGR